MASMRDSQSSSSSASGAASPWVSSKRVASIKAGSIGGDAMGGCGKFFQGRHEASAEGSGDLGMDPGHPGPHRQLHPVAVEGRPAARGLQPPHPEPLMMNWDPT
eukprot:755214-Hanusia_phi.AAC.1